MCKFPRAAWLAAWLLSGFLPAVLAQPARFEGIGRTATPAEIQAWDIDVRPDFQGLPKGSGSVQQGETLWEARCASCHGSFGESNDVFTPVAGGVEAKDQAGGRVASLLPGSNQPQRTTLMKLATVSTLWDYIRRAMPWNAPKSLSADEVYAVTAYILHLGLVLPADFTLTDANLPSVQQILPNRNGMSNRHAFWPGREFAPAARPDVQGSNCMRDCRGAPVVISQIPDYARNAHGNLAEQMRQLGPTRGVQTAAASVPAVAGAAPRPGAPTAVLSKNACTACHAMDSKLVGPAFSEVARKYQGRADATSYLAGKIQSGGQGVWGSIPMPAQAMDEADLQRVARWLADGARP